MVYPVRLLKSYKPIPKKLLRKINETGAQIAKSGRKEVKRNKPQKIPATMPKVGRLKNRQNMANRQATSYTIKKHYRLTHLLGKKGGQCVTVNDTGQ